METRKEIMKKLSMPSSFLTILFIASFFLLFQSTCFATTVTLAWDPSDGADGYNVYYQQTTSSTQPAQPFSGTGADEGDSPIQKVGNTNTSATISGLDPHYFYFFAVTAYNSTGESAYSNIVFIPELVPPAVSITSPSNNATVSNTVTVNADATDSYGVSKVEFYVNGALQSTDTSSPYSFSWNTSSLAAGKYTLMVKAYDANNNAGQSANVIVTVSSAVSPQPGTFTRTFGNAAGSNYLNTVQDTFLETNDNVNAAAMTLNTMTSPANRPSNAILMKWDLSALPANAQIVNATLSLYMTGSSGDSLYKIPVAKIINVNPVTASCNGNTYDGSNPWNPSTVTYNHVPMAQGDIATPVDNPQIDTTVGYKSWNVTNIIQDWIANPSTNFGLLLNSSSSTSSDSYRYFASSEASDETERPILSITYTVTPTIIWRNSSNGQNAVWFMNGKTISSKGFINSMPDQNWQIVGTGDFNGDGKPDIVWRNKVTGANAVWYMDGTNVTGTASLPSLADTNWQIASVADIDNDGKTDLVWRNTSNGQNAVWYMNGTTRIGSDFFPALPDQNWQIVGLGDFNADGKPDLVWRNSVTGENAVWYMNGTTRVGSAFLPPMRDINWKIQSVCDFNNNNRPDLVWRNVSNGQNAVWYMNGTTRTGSDYLPNLQDQNWQIVSH